ncbi:MAG: hypothetical protein IPM82_14760 [Saprospiraceae bacterium]|nr:hypothetical protein [Saprospiraceae bacterium]
MEYRRWFVSWNSSTIRYFGALAVCWSPPVVLEQPVEPEQQVVEVHRPAATLAAGDVFFVNLVEKRALGPICPPPSYPPD